MILPLITLTLSLLTLAVSIFFHLYLFVIIFSFLTALTIFLIFQSFYVNLKQDNDRKFFSLFNLLDEKDEDIYIHIKTGSELPLS